MNILIVGGAGFLGANLVRRCLGEHEAHVTVLDSLEPRLRATTAALLPVWDRIRFVHGSMCDQALIGELVQGQDIIFNCAAQTSHPLSMQEPLFDAEINCIGNLTLLEAARLLNPGARIVYTSSSTVIGKAQSAVVDETHAEKPLDIYSANKGVAEKYYAIYHRAYDLRTVVLRFANIFGPYGKGYPEFSFINYFVHLAWSGQDIKVFGAGDQSRNALFVDDATEILWRAAHDDRLVGNSWLAAHEEHHSVIDIAHKVVGVLGRGKVMHVPWPEDRRRIEIDSVTISAARLRDTTGWRPRYSLEEGLRRTRTVLEGGMPS